MRYRFACPGGRPKVAGGEARNERNHRIPRPLPLRAPEGLPEPRGPGNYPRVKKSLSVSLSLSIYLSVFPKRRKRRGFDYDYDYDYDYDNDNDYENTIPITTTTTTCDTDLLAPEGRPKVAGGEARNERNHRIPRPLPLRAPEGLPEPRGPGNYPRVKKSLSLSVSLSLSIYLTFPLKNRPPQTPARANGLAFTAPSYAKRQSLIRLTPTATPASAIPSHRPCARRARALGRSDP